jgi:SNF2 family DNA or RNA helicase
MEDKAKANKVFETLIETRMKRFDLLLERSQFLKKQWQQEGVEWCLRNELRSNPLYDIRGGIIADEMGLGKTIQMIGLMLTNFLKRTLIIVPPALIEQWSLEIYKTTGHQVLRYHNKNLKFLTPEIVGNSPIVLTTYGTICSKKCKLQNLEWSRIICDEAHHLRNSNTQRYRACQNIVAKIHWLVTGTPVQNKRKDLYNLCSIIGLKLDKKVDEIKQKSLLNQFMLRRTKTQVGIKMPELKEECVKINWKNAGEKELVEEIHALIPNQSGVFVDKIKMQKLREIFGKGGILTCLLRAKQSCIMPCLMTKHKNMEMFEGLGFEKDKYMESLKYSSKIDTVVDYIDKKKDNGKGKIIFCHYSHEIDEIERRLLEIGMKNVKKYDGRNSGPATLKKLSEPADALILQIQTGSEGLNLQENYSEIYFVSPHWNPAIEDQAVGRCYRLGQKNKVDVYKFGMDGFTEADRSFEIYVTEKQKVKREASNKILA